MKWMFWRRREPAQIVELLVRQADLTQRGLLLQQYMREPLPAVADELHHVEEAAGDVDSAVPTAANAVNVGDAFEWVTDGASSTTATLHCFAIIRHT